MPLKIFIVTDDGVVGLNQLTGSQPFSLNNQIGDCLRPKYTVQITKGKMKMNAKYWYEKSFPSTELIAKASLTQDKD